MLAHSSLKHQQKATQVRPVLEYAYDNTSIGVAEAFLQIAKETISTKGKLTDVLVMIKLWTAS